jgi:hypothetical protein
VPGVVVHISNTCIPEAEAGRFKVQGQPRRKRAMIRRRSRRRKKRRKRKKRRRKPHFEFYSEVSYTTLCVFVVVGNLETKQ